MGNHTNILIAGVGGQGSLLTSRIIGNTAIRLGCDVKVSEVHGMSQRGGSVVTYVKYAEPKVHSPIIDIGQADIVLAFEQLEAYRNVGYLKKGGKLLANCQTINPMPVITGTEEYPAGLPEKIRALGVDCVFVDALKTAEEAGNAKTVNVVMIGLLAAALDIPKADWIEAIRETVPARFLPVNMKAFELGYTLVS